MMSAGPAIRIAWRDLLVDRARTGLIVTLLAIAAIWLTVIAGTPAMNAIGTLLFIVAVLVQISALAVGDRDRLRVLGLLDVNGARVGVQRLVAFLQAMILGVGGALVGLVVGVVLRTASLASSPGLRFSDAVEVLALCTGASFAAGAFSALRRDRIPTRAALAGRRPSGTPGYRRLGGSVALVVAGAWLAGSADSWSGMFFSVPLGGLLVAVGAIGIALFIASRLPRVTRPLGGAISHAGKGLARQRYRIGPLLALMTVVIGFCMVGAVMGRSFGEREDRRLAFHKRFVVPTIATSILPDTLVRVDGLADAPVVGNQPSDAREATLQKALHRAFPAAQFLRLNGLARNGSPLEAPLVYQHGGDERNIPRLVVIGDAHLLDALGVKGHTADLAAGRAVALTPFVNDRNSIGLPSSAGRIVRFPAVSAGNKSTRAWPAVVLSAGAAQRLGRAPIRVATVIRSPQPVNADQAQAVRNAVQASFGLTPDTFGGNQPDGIFGLLPGAPAIGGELTDASSYGRGGLFGSDHSGDLAAGPFINTNGHQMRTVIITGGALALGAVIIALTLASLDRRRDDELFALLGAPQRFRRRLGAAQAAMLATIASGVGTALGLAAPAYAFWLYNHHRRGTLPPIPFVLPVEAVVVLLVAVPLLAVAATWALTPATSRGQVRWFDD